MKADVLISTSNPELLAFGASPHPPRTPSPGEASRQGPQILIRDSVELRPADAEQICDLAALGSLRIDVQSAAMQQSLSLHNCHARDLGDWCELRGDKGRVWIQPGAISRGRAYIERVTAGWRRVIDYQDAQGRALIRVCLTPGGDPAAFDSFRTVYSDRPHSLPVIRHRQASETPAGDPWRSPCADRERLAAGGVGRFLIGLAQHGLDDAGTRLGIEAGCEAGLRILLQIAAENDLPLQISLVRPGCIQRWSGVLSAAPDGDGFWRSQDSANVGLRFDEQQFRHAWILDDGSANPGWLVSDPSGQSFLVIHLDESLLAARAAIPVQWPSLISYLAVRGKDKAAGAATATGVRS